MVEGMGAKLMGSTYSEPWSACRGAAFDELVVGFFGHVVSGLVEIDTVALLPHGI
jgi:hypothetical protein